jgi:hypothetical protein
MQAHLKDKRDDVAANKGYGISLRGKAGEAGSVGDYDARETEVDRGREEGRSHGEADEVTTR